MCLLKFFLVFAFLLCLMKPCLIEAEKIAPRGHHSDTLERGIRSVAIAVI